MTFSSKSSTYSRLLIVTGGLSLAAFAACKSSNKPIPPPVGCAPKIVSGAVAITHTVGPNVVRVGGLIPGHKQLHSHIPKKVREFTDRGKMSDTQSLSVVVSMELNNEAQLDQLLKEMYTPGKPNYRKFITPGVFKANYAPTPAQVEAVRQHFATEGVSIEPIANDETGILLRATAPVKSLNRLFNTEIHHYSDNNGVVFHAPANELQVPGGLSIHSVHGLHNVTTRIPHARLHPGIAPSATFAPTNGLTPQQITNAYEVPTSRTGAGETMALFELDAFTPSDITQYAAAFGLQSVPVVPVAVDGGATLGQGAAEVTLDIELMMAIAPGVNKILVYEGPNSDQGVLDIYAKIANDNSAREVSTSWGAPETSSTTSFLESENTIFKQMAAQGQTIFAAAGDSGAYDNGSALTVDDPASQPYVTGVGGTQLNISGNGGYNGEVVWNNSGTSGRPSTAGGGGGGISSVWAQPTYQNGAISAASKGSASSRNVPDVSLDADPQTGYAIFFQGNWQVYGGTSCAAPLWAGFTALVNQGRSVNGMAALGFANPLLYQIGLSTRYASDFHDINVPAGNPQSTNMFYPAVAGYDEATGWGSFVGQQLFNDLTTPSVTLPPGPPVTPPTATPTPVPGC